MLKRGKNEIILLLTFLVGVIILSLILSTFVAIASFEEGDLTYLIDEDYPPEGYISGWINLSFDNEPSNSLFSGNYGGEISLIDLLDENLADYECTPEDCGDSYNAENKASSKTFSFELDKKEKIYSFKISGEIEEIIEDGFSFNIEATSTSDSCLNPLKIDLLNDGEIEWAANKSSEDFSCLFEEGYGCFDPSTQEGETSIGTTPYCNRMNLTESPSFKLGAWIRIPLESDTEYATDLLRMELYDSEGDDIVSCNLPEPTEEGGEVDCIVEYLNPEIQEFYVCLIAKEDTDYKTRFEQNSPVCGFKHSPPSEEKADYQIYAKGAKFENVGLINFNNDNVNIEDVEEFLGDYIEEYVDDKFNLECKGDCVVPFKIIGNGGVNIEVSNLVAKYETDVTSEETKDIYDSEETPSLINADFQKLDIDAGEFNVHSSYGEKTFNLKFNGQSIISEKINQD